MIVVVDIWCGSWVWLGDVIGKGKGGLRDWRGFGREVVRGGILCGGELHCWALFLVLGMGRIGFVVVVVEQRLVSLWWVWTMTLSWIGGLWSSRVGEGIVGFVHMVGLS